MQTQPAKRYSKQSHHKSYGIYNWFKSKRIFDQEVMKETMANFCIKNHIDISRDTNENIMVNFCQNNFPLFANFAIPFLEENNYL